MKLLSPSSIFSKTSRVSAIRCVEFTATASPACSLIESTWSFCNAISGEMTSVGPFSSRPAIW